MIPTGVIAPVVTPFAGPDEAIDHAALRALVADLAEAGVDGLMPTALTGEGPLLSPEETTAVWDTVFAAADGLPVIPAVIATRTPTAVALVLEAERRGAAAAMVAPIVPELYAGRSEDDVVGFHADVARASGLPLILFNYPSLTGADLTPELVRRLAGIDAVTHIKESTGDSKRVHAIRRLAGDRIEVICGAPNVALESLALGCRTWITGIVNVVPRSAIQLVRRVADGDLTGARAAYERQILPVVDVLAATLNPTGTIKAGVRARGVEVGVPRRPGSDLSPHDRAALAELCAEIAALERSGR